MSIAFSKTMILMPKIKRKIPANSNYKKTKFAVKRLED